MFDIFKLPFSKGLINAVRFTFSFPFQTKELIKLNEPFEFGRLYSNKLKWIIEL